MLVRAPITHQSCLANIAFCLSICIFRHFLVQMTTLEQLPHSYYYYYFMTVHFQVSKLAQRVRFVDLSKIWFVPQKCTVLDIKVDLLCIGNQLRDRLCKDENLRREFQELAIYLYTPLLDRVAHCRTSSQNWST